MKIEIDSLQGVLLTRKKRSIKPKPPENELIQFFWDSPMSAFFSDEVVAPVIGRKRKTLQCDRWRGVGIPYRKCLGRVLYQKADVVAWLEGHQLVSSTSEQDQGVRHVV